MDINRAIISNADENTSRGKEIEGQVDDWVIGFVPTIQQQHRDAKDGEEGLTADLKSSETSNLEVSTCVICDVKFSGMYRKSNLNRHFRNKHKLDRPWYQGSNEVSIRADGSLKQYRSGHTPLSSGSAIRRKVTVAHNSNHEEIQATQSTYEGTMSSPSGGSRIHALDEVEDFEHKERFIRRPLGDFIDRPTTNELNGLFGPSAENLQAANYRMVRMMTGGVRQRDAPDPLTAANASDRHPVSDCFTVEQMNDDKLEAEALEDTRRHIWRTV